MKYFCLGDDHTVTGFKLAGIEGEAVVTGPQAEAAFDRVVAGQDVGIILITEKTAGLIREKVDNFLYTHEFPLIMEIPDKDGADPSRKPVIDLIRRAVGVNVNG